MGAAGVRPLVGRAAERAAIASALDEARSGAGGSLLVAGSAGIGKTALLHWAAHEALGFVVLHATGSVRNASEPFSLIRSLMESVASLEDDRRPAEYDAVVAALSGSRAAPERFALGLALVSLFGALAEVSPLLIEVDDVQWADPSSIDALRTASDRLAGDPVLFVFALRSGEPTALDDSKVLPLVVTELTVDESCELLSDRVAPDVARRIADASIGNPLVLGELAKSLDAEQRAGIAPLDERIFESPSAERGFLARVDALGSTARSLLTLASADSAIEEQLLRDAAAELGGDAAALDALVDLGFLVPDDGGAALVFAHPLLRVALYRSMPAATRRTAHRAIAARLSDEQLHRKAWHLAASADGHDEVAAASLERAAEHARDGGAYAVAGETFVRSAELSEGDREGRRRLIAAGEAYLLAGDLERAGGALDGALALADEQLARADIQLARAPISRARPSGSVYAELVGEAEATAPIDSSRAAMLFAHATFSALMDLHFDAVRVVADRAMELATEDHPAYMLARFGRSGAEMIAGNHRVAAPVFREFAEVIEAAGPSAELGSMADYLVVAFTQSGEFDSCPQISVPLIEYERSIGALGMLPLSLACYSHYLFRTGQWMLAIGVANEAIDLARETRQYLDLAHALVAATLIEAASGRFAEARVHANELLPLSEGPGMRFSEYLAFAALGFLEMSTGNYAAAKALLLRDRDIAQSCGLHHPTATMWQSDLVDAAWLLGERDFAREISDQLTADAIDNGLPYGLALAARCRGTIAVDSDEAAAEFEAALQFHGVVADPFQRARSSLAYGERLAAEGRADDAAVSLTAAAEEFERLGAVPWERRARRHLPAVEEGTDRVAASPLELLSARELQVALLVVDGKTSREVAGELFLSRRTVEFHLATIYRKLGVANRMHLARVIYPHMEQSR